MTSFQEHSTREEQGVSTSPYVPLNPSHHEIRLASLASGHFEDPIVIDLHIRRLSEDAEPDYEALSYVWGQKPCVQQAIVNDRPVPVTTNLGSALRHLRSTTKSRVMWIDALCIDQENVLERSSQVQMMDRIYSTARTVLIWLGSADAETEKAMTLLKKPSDLDAHAIVSLTKIYRRPWFYRIWVYQELVLARNDPIVHLGHDSMPWSVFYDYLASGPLNSVWQRMLQSLERAGYPSYIIDFEVAATHVMALGQVRIRRKRGQKLSLLADLMTTRFCQATDPRDKIYGLLGLHSSRTPAITMLPDYTKTVQEVFMETTARVMQTYQPIALYLSFPLHEWHEVDEAASPRMPNLPSWAIDITLLSKRNSVPVEYLYDVSWPKDQDTSKRLSGSFAHFPTTEKLHTIGTFIGTIEAISQGLLLQSCWKEDDSIWMDGILQMLRDTYHGLLRPRGVSVKEFVYTLRPEQKAFHGIPMREFDSALEQLFGSTPDDHGLSNVLTEMQEKIITQIGEYSLGEFIFVTDTGKVGTVYHPDYKNGIRPGDVVVGLFRQNLPFVLRQVGSTGECQMINAANLTRHRFGRVALDEAPESVTELDVWGDLERYGLEEYVIV